jgi:nucleoside-diphosphate-sugar epimerase
MKILIIGGTGLISTTITADLVGGGDEVVLYNRGESFYATPPSVRTIHGDRTNYAAFENDIKEAGLFDCVIDMVGYQPEDAGSLVRAFKGRTGQLIFCSTVDVYQKPASHYPYTEEEPYGGLNAYSCNKVIIEKKLLEAAENKAFPLTIIRPAYTYGEGRGPLHPFSRTAYIDRLRKHKPIVVQGDGTSLWTCCHAGDVGRAFVAAVGNQAAYGQTYHAAGEEWLTWNQYHQQAAQAIGAPEPELVHIPSDMLAKTTRVKLSAENFQFCNIFDNARARQDLQFNYTVTWKEGVRRMVTWLDERGQIDNSDLDPYEDRVIAAWRGVEKSMLYAGLV